jgi:hypothetical protein
MEGKLERVDALHKAFFAGSNTLVEEPHHEKSYRGGFLRSTGEQKKTGLHDILRQKPSNR